MWTRCCHPPFQKEQEIMKSPNPLQMAGRREGWRRNGGSPRFSSPGSEAARVSIFFFFFFFSFPRRLKMHRSNLEPSLAQGPTMDCLYTPLYRVCLNIMVLPHVHSLATLLETPAYFKDHLIKWPASERKEGLEVLLFVHRGYNCRPRSHPLAV